MCDAPRLRSTVGVSGFEGISGTSGGFDRLLSLRPLLSSLSAGRDGLRIVRRHKWRYGLYGRQCGSAPWAAVSASALPGEATHCLDCLLRAVFFMTPVLYDDEKRVASPPLRRGTSQRHQDLVAASVGMNYFVAAHLKTPSDLDVTK